MQANGSIEIEVDGGAVSFPNADYTIELYDGQNTSTLLASVAGNDPGLVVNGGNPVADTLFGQYYTVVIQNNLTSCRSTPVNEEVLDNTVDPTLVVTATDQTSCDPATLNGEIQADVTAPLTSTYTIKWFDDADTLAGTNIGEINGWDPNTDPPFTVSGLGTGTYTAFVYDEISGCTNLQSLILDEVIEEPIVTAIANESTTCNPFDATIVPDITNIASVPAPSGFDFLWYRGLNNDTTYLTTTSGNNGDASTHLTSGTLTAIGDDIYAGYYTVSAHDINANCNSEPFFIELTAPSNFLDIEFIENFLPAECNAQ